ncbi:CoA transferase, partial [bacterium]|nr:CoA transferase [bacterium]
WVEACSGIDACVEPVLTVSEAMDSRHAAGRGLVVDVPGPDGTPIRQVGLPIRFSGYTPRYRWAGPSLGRDTGEVLKSLGIADREIKEMKSKGIVSGV